MSKPHSRAGIYHQNQPSRKNHSLSFAAGYAPPKRGIGNPKPETPHVDVYWPNPLPTVEEMAQRLARMRNKAKKPGTWEYETAAHMLTGFTAQREVYEAWRAEQDYTNLQTEES